MTDEVNWDKGRLMSCTQVKGDDSDEVLFFESLPKNYFKHFQLPQQSRQSTVAMLPNLS